MTQNALINELTAAVERAPEAVELRLHLAELLLQDGQVTEALGHCSAALAQDATNATAVALLQRCSNALTTKADPAPTAAGEGFDWPAAEQQVSHIIEPAFVDSHDRPSALDAADYESVQRSTVRLRDVAGMPEVKKQLELSLLGPISNPEMMKAYKISARGGLLLYGPPGCGKTFLARAISGELGASFLPVGIADVLHRWFGDSERALHEIFETARRNSPCVLFFDEVDALGQRRAALSSHSSLRLVVNTLLAELDSATSSNDGVYVLGATNMPWDVDPALRRPGRFDRMVFVGLPDTDARTEILRSNLRDRPVAGIDLRRLADRTEGLSGADLAHACESATQIALADSLQTGEVRPVGMSDLESALAQIKPSTGPWFDVARNIVEFGNNDGTYDELAKYVRRRRFR
ncbi:ATP-binding protein [Mycolicibacterium fluoranthenivorans]|uniref:Tetratricopeptide repeat-containing protein n=1 Tax=Mycolicibacterium fluoranthenivorans TaxID=258505 RepID=A0A1G4W281_9MYCO|nr:ATP-binding protein [Mycolicibacterium fluoranthenivorans]SCX15123.1 Tetratricopeptide repeat-containing protein [Mycolicibacterium fluoranthenivorans]